MVGVAFLALVILALVNIAFWWVMRIRLMRMDSARDRIEWLSFRSGDDVLDTYAALFPHSVLPRYCLHSGRLLCPPLESVEGRVDTVSTLGCGRRDRTGTLETHDLGGAGVPPTH